LYRLISEMPGYWNWGTALIETYNMKSYSINKFGPDVNFINILLQDIVDIDMLRLNIGVNM